MLNRIQKEALCALLLIQGKSFRYIAKTCHLSFTDIGKINRKIFGEEPNYIQNKKITKTTKALVLFSRGKLPLEVCIELDMDPEVVEKSYSSFLRLKGLSKFAKIIEDPDENFMESLEFHEFCKKKSIDNNQIVDIMDKCKDISHLNSNCNILVRKEQDIKTRSEKAFKNLENVQYQIQNTNKNLENTLSKLSKLENTINQKRKEFSALVQSMNNLKNEDNFKIYEQRLLEIFNKIISEDALKIPLIIVAFLEVFRDKPIHNQIFFHYYQTFKDGNIKEDLKSKQDYIFLNFLHFIYDLSKKIQNVYRNKTISDFHDENSLGTPQYQNFL